MTRNEVFKKICGIIGRPGQSQAIVNRVLEIWDAVATRRPIPANQALCKSTPADAGVKKKDTRPVSIYHWKVQHPDGSLWDYRMSPSGALKVQEQGEYQVETYTLDQWRKLHQQHIEEHSKDKGIIRKSARGGNNIMMKLDRLILTARQHPEKLSSATLAAVNNHLAKTGQPAIRQAPEGHHNAKPQQPWGTPRRLWSTAPSNPVMVDVSAPRQPVVTPAPDKTASHRSPPLDTSKLSGHQMAALKAGLDIDTPNLQMMSFDQMKALAHQQNVQSTQSLREKVGICHEPANGTYNHRR